MGEEDVCPKGLRQAFMRREFLAVVHCQGIPHISGYGLKGADSGFVQSRHPLVWRCFCQKKFCFPVNKSRYVDVFTGTFHSVALTVVRMGLLFGNVQTFINGNTVKYLAVAVFCPFRWRGFA
jgi:hypothetical protein